MMRPYTYVLLAFAFLAAVFSPLQARATPSVGSGVQSTTAIINKIVNSTPGLNTVTTTGTGAVVRSTASTAVNAGRGLTIAVPTVAEATVTAGRLAGIAGRVAKAGNFIGIAALVAPWILEKSGYKVCPPPDFFCKEGPQVADTADPSSGGFYVSDNDPKLTTFGSTPETVCQKYAAKKGYDAAKVSYRNGQCMMPSGNGNYYSLGVMKYQDMVCPAGTTKGTDSRGLSACLKPGPDVPATESDIAGSVEGAITGNPNRIGQLHSAESAANLPVFAPSDAVTVTASPVTTPKTTTTTVVPNPDGSTSTVKTESQTEVKPQPTGGTLGDTKVIYPTTTTTTTTTTNNVTNVTTVQTTVINNYGTEAANQPSVPDVKPPTIPDAGAPPVIAPSQEIKFPDDYNREVTQKAMLAELDGSKLPPTPQDQEARTKEKTDSADKSLADKFKELPSQFVPDKENWFSWVWTPPVAQCSASMFQGTVHGNTINWDICPWVENIRSAIGFLFALFGAMNIYSNLFRKGDE